VSLEKNTIKEESVGKFKKLTMIFYPESTERLWRQLLLVKLKF